MGNIRSKVATNNAVPGRIVFFVELFLDIRSDILLDVELFERMHRTINSILLHVLCHVGILYHCFTTFRHDSKRKRPEEQRSEVVVDVQKCDLREQNAEPRGQ